LGITLVRSYVNAHRYLALCIAGTAFVLFWGLPTLVIPFAADQSWFALGARTVLRGDQLYRDFHDQKPPLIYLLYAVPQFIAGASYEAVRVFDLFNTLLAMAGVFFLTKRFLPERAAILAAAVYGFVYLTSVESDGLAETESFIAAPLTFALAIYPVRSDKRALPAAFVSGLFLGLAFSLKFSIAPFVLALPVMELMLRDRQTWEWTGAVKRLTVAAAAFLLIQAGWVGYLAFAGVLDDFIDIQRNFTIHYQNLRWSPNYEPYIRSAFISTEAWLSRAWYITALAWVGLLLLLIRGPRSAGYLLGLLAAVAIASVWWQGKFFQYHWIITFPVLAPLAGYFLHSILEGLRGLPRTPVLAVSAAVLIGFGVMATDPLLRTYDAYSLLYHRVAGDRSQDQTDALYNSVLGLNHELVDYVRENSDPDEPFVIWGTWPQALLLADRPSSTSFVTSPALRAKWTPDKWRREYIEDLQAVPPRFFAVVEGDWQPWLTGTDRSSREDFCDNYRELRTLIEADYLPVFNNGLFILYDREATEAEATGACP
jgi:4-amino-4-deoxy-L-arabinose transferase-like glycosyltransferase